MADALTDGRVVLAMSHCGHPTWASGRVDSGEQNVVIRLDRIAEHCGGVNPDGSPGWGGRCVGALFQLESEVATGVVQAVAVGKALRHETRPPCGDRIVIVAPATRDPFLSAVLILVHHHRMQESHFDTVEIFSGAQRPVIVAT